MLEDYEKAETALKVRDKGEVEVQFERLQDIAERLDGAHSSLEMRLLSITKEAMPREVKRDEDMPGLVPLADSLYRLGDQLEALIHRIIYLESRIAL